MKTCRVCDLFKVEYGNSLELIYLEKKADGINFISRTSKRNGVSAKVKEIASVSPFQAGLITVAVGGSVLETFLQNSPFYTGFHVMVLTPIKPMSTEVKLFYCNCIKANQFKYSYGRQANSSLPDLKIPTIDSVPEYVKLFSIRKYGIDLLKQIEIPQTKVTHFNQEDNLIFLSKLFNLHNGLASSQVLKSNEKKSENWIPFIRPSFRQETSFDSYVNKKLVPKNKIFPSETLYISTNGQGSHTYSYVSATEFVPNSDVTVLLPKREMGLLEKLFYAHCITQNRYKFSYGRKPKGNRIKSIVLPAHPPYYVTNFDVNQIINNLGSVLSAL